MTEKTHLSGRDRVVLAFICCVLAPFLILGMTLALQTVQFDSRFSKLMAGGHERSVAAVVAASEIRSPAVPLVWQAVFEYLATPDDVIPERLNQMVHRKVVALAEQGLVCFENALPLRCWSDVPQRLLLWANVRQDRELTHRAMILEFVVKTPYSELRKIRQGNPNWMERLLSTPVH